MRHYSRYIILAGSIISFFCFSLPWYDGLSGAELANVKVWLESFVFTLSLIITITSLLILQRSSRVVSRWVLTSALFMVSLGILLSSVTFLQILKKGFNPIIASFVTCLAITVIAIYLFNQTSAHDSITRKSILIYSVGGFCCFLLLFFNDNYIIGSDITLDGTRYGAFLTAIGYIITIIGYTCLEKPEDRSVESIEENNVQEQNTEGGEE